MDIYKKCHYSIIGNEQIKHSGSITNSLSCGCQILISSIRSISVNSSSQLCIENIISLIKDIDLDNIYNDINNNIFKNNTLLTNCIYTQSNNLF